MSGTSVTSEVDFEAIVKQPGFRRLTHSAYRPAYDWIPIRIPAMKDGKDHALSVMAGICNDQPEGQIAASLLGRE